MIRTSKLIPLDTPAFVYDENKILKQIKLLVKVKKRSGVKIVFPAKSFAVPDGLKFIASFLDGFSVSSIFEAQLARSIGGTSKSIHITTPGFKLEEILPVSRVCDYISFNSLSQWEKHNEVAGKGASCGLRINPQISFLNDERYDPCRRRSKLGTPLDALKMAEKKRSGLLSNVRGLLFHTNCESNDLSNLFKTVQHIDIHLGELLPRLDWINLGGGYLFEKGQDLQMLTDAVILLKKKYDLETFFEPGKAIVGSAGVIVSSVIDIFQSEDRMVAVLDTTVNHMPEVFEYQYKPDIAQESEDGKHSYILAGATCLAGDIFGEHRFDEPLKIGARIVFENMGAYTLVKANMFNGINLPTIYAYTLGGKLEMKRRFTYEDFLSRCGANGNVPL